MSRQSGWAQTRGAKVMVKLYHWRSSSFGAGLAGRDRRSPRGAFVSGVGEMLTLRHQNDTPIGGQCHFVAECPIRAFARAAGGGEWRRAPWRAGAMQSNTRPTVRPRVCVTLSVGVPVNGRLQARRPRPAGRGLHKAAFPVPGVDAGNGRVIVEASQGVLLGSTAPGGCHRAGAYLCPVSGSYWKPTPTDYSLWRTSPWGHSTATAVPRRVADWSTPLPAQISRSILAGYPMIDRGALII